MMYQMNYVNRQPRIFDDPFFRSVMGMEPARRPQGMRVDVQETQDAYILEAELPGVKLEDITLTAEDDVLTIAAEVNTEKQEQKANYLCSERRAGHMERRFNLEKIDQEHVTARFENGVLLVALPKAQPQKPKEARKISIEG